MKRLSISTLLVIGLLATGTLQAQEQPQPLSIDTLAARETRFLSEKLSLSSEQTTKVQTVLKGVYQEQQGLPVNAKDATQRKQQLQAARTAHQEALKKILTPEQWNAYEKGVEERRAAFLKYAREKKIPVQELDKQ